MSIIHWLLLFQMGFAQDQFCSKHSDHILERCGDNTQVGLRGLKTQHYTSDMQGSIFVRSTLIRNRVNGINFSFSNNKQIQVRDSWFINCEYNKASFLGSYIKRSNFEGSSFREANFSGSKIENTSFKNADLSHANFDNAVLIFVDFSGANIEGVNFDKATLLSVKFK